MGDEYRIRLIKCTVRVEVGKFYVEGMLAIFRFTAHLNDCQSKRIGRYCIFSLSLFSLLRRLNRANTVQVLNPYAAGC